MRSLLRALVSGLAGLVLLPAVSSPALATGLEIRQATRAVWTTIYSYNGFRGGTRDITEERSTNYEVGAWVLGGRPNFQDSFIGESEISGILQASVERRSGTQCITEDGFPYCWDWSVSREGGSKLEVIFDVLSDLPYTYTASGPGRVTLELMDGDVALMTVGLEAQGLLSAGTYRLEAVAYHDDRSLEFAFIVPEPGTALLLGVGFLGMGLFRRSGAA